MSGRMLLNRRNGMDVHATIQNDGKLIVEYSEDVQPHLDHNKALQAADDIHVRRKQDMWHVAHIPTTVIYKWMKEDGIDVYNPEHDAAVNAKLNSNEWRYLKTAEIIL